MKTSDKRPATSDERASVIASPAGAKQSLRYHKTYRIDCFVAAMRLLAMTVFSLWSLVSSLQSIALAADKNWNSEGDQSSWFDDANWLPAGTPSAADDARVDFKDASVDVPQSFQARSLTIGGKKTSSVNVSNFISGEITPSNVAEEAITNRRNGYLILKGSTGKITLKGAYKDSEEVIPDEPSFMVYVQ